MPVSSTSSVRSRLSRPSTAICRTMARSTAPSGCPHVFHAGSVHSGAPVRHCRPNGRRVIICGVRARSVGRPPGRRRSCRAVTTSRSGRGPHAGCPRSVQPGLARPRGHRCSRIASVRRLGRPDPSPSGGAPRLPPGKTAARRWSRRRGWSAGSAATAHPRWARWPDADRAGGVVHRVRVRVLGPARVALQPAELTQRGQVGLVHQLAEQVVDRMQHRRGMRLHRDPVTRRQVPEPEPAAVPVGRSRWLRLVWPARHLQIVAMLHDDRGTRRHLPSAPRRSTSGFGDDHAGITRASSEKCWRRSASGCSLVSGSWTSLPFSNLAQARTRSTRWDSWSLGAPSARPGSCRTPAAPRRCQ